MIPSPCPCVDATTLSPASTAIFPLHTLLMHRRLFVAAYDVSHPRRLRQALEVLKGYSTGGQKSVFECFLTEGERGSLLREIKSVLEFQEDRFLLLPVDPGAEVQTLGVAVPPSDPTYYYVD